MTFNSSRLDSQKLVPTRNSTQNFGKKFGMQGLTFLLIIWRSIFSGRIRGYCHVFDWFLSLCDLAGLQHHVRDPDVGRQQEEVERQRRELRHHLAAESEQQQLTEIWFELLFISLLK